MAIFNGRDWTVDDMLPFKYVENWDDFFDDVIAEMSARTASVGGALSATSTTSLIIGTGTKSLTVAANKAFAAGQPITIALTADVTKYMFGAVTSYDAVMGALVVSVSDAAGSGTYAAWTVSLAGPKGAAGGATLPPGSTSAPGLAVTGDANTGIAQVGGADTVSMVAGGVEVLRAAGANVILSPSVGAYFPADGRLIAANVYFDPTLPGWKYAGNGYASLVTFTNGEVRFSTAGQNTAGPGTTTNPVIQAKVIHTSGADRSLTLTGSAGGDPSIGTTSGAVAFSAPAKGKQVTIPFASTIVLDFAAQDYVIGDLTGPLTLANPSAYPVGQRGEILIHEDGSGGRTVGFAGNWFKVGKDGVNTTAGKYSVITYWVVASNVVVYSIAGGA